MGSSSFLKTRSSRGHILSWASWLSILHTPRAGNLGYVGGRGALLSRAWLWSRRAECTPMCRTRGAEDHCFSLSPSFPKLLLEV